MAGDLFARGVAGPDGAVMPALPLPLASDFRAAAEVRPAPRLGADTEAVLGPAGSTDLDRTASAVFDFYAQALGTGTS